MKRQDSLRPAGAWEVRRRIKIPALVHAADAIAIERALEELSGVRKAAADVDNHQVIVRYNIIRTDYQAVVEILESAGFSPLNNWWSRYKAGWFQYVDTNGRDNANMPPSHCCNKSPK
ncbi:MAG: heavy metal-associated domain-containing protein [Pseudomonadota bacterium]